MLITVTTTNITGNGASSPIFISQFFLRFVALSYRITWCQINYIRKKSVISFWEHLHIHGSSSQFFVEILRQFILHQSLNGGTEKTQMHVMTTKLTHDFRFKFSHCFFLFSCKYIKLIMFSGPRLFFLRRQLSIFDVSGDQGENHQCRRPSAVTSEHLQSLLITTSSRLLIECLLLFSMNAIPLANC
jgi:hypothetical protein